MSQPLVSILINNYNYGRFLGVAIDSALSQTYSPIEVVVVDDGSTDHSRDVIESYGDRIVSVFKANGGQASAFNAGITASRGEILCFLDADDLFYPNKVERVVEAYRDNGLDTKPMMVHHFLDWLNKDGEKLDEPPSGNSHGPALNLYAFAQRHRYVWFEAGSTSSLSINRSLAALLFPLPEQDFRILSDFPIVCATPLVGELHSLRDVLGGYRMHGNNHWQQSARVEPHVTPQFAKVLQNYLNATLTANGKLPVIDYDNSIYAWWKYADQKQFSKLIWSMLRICARDHDRHTFFMAYCTLMEVGMAAKKSMLQSRSALVAHFRRGRAI